MNLYDNELYLEDIDYVAGLELPWEMLQGKSILISGASGLIASCLIDVIMNKNDDGLNCKMYALGRNVERAKKRFGKHWKNSLFEFTRY